MRRPKPVYIYGLRDPRDGKYHYIGKADKPEKRLAQHLRDKKTNSDRVAWLQDLVCCGLEPEMVILSEADRDDWQEIEKLWIARGREAGWPLTNLSAGGGGGGEPSFSFFDGYLSPGDRERFNALSVTERWEVCRQTARAMAAVHKQALATKGGGQRADWVVWNDRIAFAGQQRAAELVTASETHEG